MQKDIILPVPENADHDAVFIDIYFLKLYHVRFLSIYVRLVYI